MTPLHPGLGHRTAAALTAVALGFGVTGCADTAGPERDVTAEDIQGVEDRLSELEDRIRVIEGSDMAPAPEDPDDVDTRVWTDPELLVGEKVTVSAEVTEVLGGNASNVAFRIADDGGEAIAVISTSAPDELHEGDVVKVPGTMTRLEESSFEDNFGMPADGVLDDPDGFFQEGDRQFAISASNLEIVEDNA